MTEKLKPCPFCGGKADVTTISTMYSLYSYVSCKECGCHTKQYSDKYEAIEAWNRRMKDE